jgi:hypothetical protein
MEIIREDRCATPNANARTVNAGDADGTCLSILACSVNQTETILEERCAPPKANAVLMGLGILTGRFACSAILKQMVRDAFTENEKLKAKVSGSMVCCRGGFGKQLTLCRLCDAGGDAGRVSNGGTRQITRLLAFV